MNRGPIAHAWYRLAIGLAGLGLLWACNDHDPHPPNTSDPGNTVNPGGGGGSTSGTADGGNLTDSGTSGSTSGTLLDAGACTDLDDPATSIDESNVSDDIPAGLGGDLTTIDGTYDLTTASRYVGASGQAGPNGLTYREVIRIKGGTSLERNRFVRQNSGPEQHVNASYVLQTATTSLTLTQKCPTTGVGETFNVTLQNGKLTLTSATGESFTYTARP